MKYFVLHRWGIFASACLLFILSQFYRASLAVITPQLIDDLALDPAGLSLMSAAFFYAFALTQIPIGITLDRVGTRRAVTVLSFFAVFGAFLLGRADSLSSAVAGRLLLGIGTACTLMGTFKLLSLWFEPARFATLSGLVFSIGTAGSIAATSPLVLFVDAVGWRNAFFILSGANLLLVAVFYLVVRDSPGNPAGIVPASTEASWRESVSALKTLFGNRDYWVISFGCFCRYGIYAAVQTLWAGPYLIRSMEFTALQTGNLILLLNIGFIVGGPAFGYCSDRLFRSRKWATVTAMAGMAAVLAILGVISPGASFWFMAGLFFGFGVFGSIAGVMYTHAKEGNPPEISGAAMTGVNFFTMIGAAGFLQGLGSLMQRLYPGGAYTPPAFRAAFLFSAACMALSTLLYLSTRETLNVRKIGR